MDHYANNSTTVRQVLTQSSHPATFTLPHGARSTYATLCALVEPGQARLLSHAEIAAVGRMSESTVSRAMPVLVEFGLIDRAAAAGGHVITMIELPAPPTADELLDQARQGCAVDPSQKGSAEDPALESQNTKGSAADPTACMEDHDHACMQQQHGRPARAGEETPPAPFTPSEWQRIRTARPEYTAQDAARDLAAARSRPNIANPVGLVVRCVLNHETIYSLAELQQRLGDHSKGQTNDQRNNAANRPGRPAETNAETNQGRPRGRGRPGGAPSHIPADYGFEFLTS